MTNGFGVKNLYSHIDKFNSETQISMKSTVGSHNESICSDELLCDEILNPEEATSLYDSASADWVWSTLNIRGIISNP